MIRIVLQMLGMVAVLLGVGVLAVLLCVVATPKDRQKEDMEQMAYLREYREKMKRKERKK